MSPALQTVEGLSGVVFLGIVAVTFLGALIAVTAKRLIRSVAGLGLCFIGVAGLYYFLNSPFVALMQLLIYAGAVCITIVFAVMLAEPKGEQQVGKRNVLVGPLSFLAAAALSWGLIAMAKDTAWLPAAERMNSGTLEEVGRSLLTTYSMSFELISVVLLLAIIGSLALARSGRSRR